MRSVIFHDCGYVLNISTGESFEKVVDFPNSRLVNHAFDGLVCNDNFEVVIKSVSGMHYALGIM